MDDEPQPHLDDVLLATLISGSENAWLVHLWSQHCAAKGLPDGTSREQPLDTRDFPLFLDRLRSAYVRYQGGNLIALLEALHICREEVITPPVWALDGIDKFITDTILKGAPGKTGRSNNPLARARLALKHELQREVIFGIRNAQRQGAEITDLMSFMLLPNEVKDYFEKHGRAPLGTSIQDAVELAEKCLRGTELQATFSTLERLFKSIPDSTFEIIEFSVRDALGITYLDETPKEFGGFFIAFPEEAEGEYMKREEVVNEKPVFWLTIRRGDITEVF
ncbi:hypothetical protein EDD52_102475 [Primorskyibacter sedentarius]|uniref:Uncharacterized protein n=1 Tax=Primorskyibacter sedentarius TaxID=745311 RepID=A0A4R3JKI2_9RHOB|nr:hypothetical protein [Primorskyibacter sedentarius]TCS66657.1 hypothetical protein EDD52_102475 [Primorskyibacter sedentarius]